MYAVAAVWVMSKKSTLFTKIEQKICVCQKKVVSLQAEMKTRIILNKRYEYFVQVAEALSLANG